MQFRILPAPTACAGALLLAGSANAAFLHVHADPYALDGNGTVPDSITWRFYAVFDNPLDQLKIVSGDDVNPLQVEAVNGSFYQHTFGSDTEPNPLLYDMFPSVEYDSFVTIGNDDSTQGTTALAPDWTPFGSGPLVEINSGWYRTPDDPFTFGVDMGEGTYGVLFLQATVLGDPLGEVVGQARMNMTQDGVSGTVPDVQFSTIIPAPGALAVLGLFGLGARRRR